MFVNALPNASEGVVLSKHQFSEMSDVSNVTGDMHACMCNFFFSFQGRQSLLFLRLVLFAVLFSPKHFSPSCVESGISNKRLTNIGAPHDANGRNDAMHAFQLLLKRFFA